MTQELILEPVGLRFPDWQALCKRSSCYALEAGISKDFKAEAANPPSNTAYLEQTCTGLLSAPFQWYRAKQDRFSCTDGRLNLLVIRRTAEVSKIGKRSITSCNLTSGHHSSGFRR